VDLTQDERVSELKNDNNAVIIDVRTLREVEEGIIPNAIHIDIYQGQGFIDRLNELDKTKNYYVYCRSGSRSRQACNVMYQLGFENAFNLMGGILQWDGEISSNE